MRLQKYFKIILLLLWLPVPSVFSQDITSANLKWTADQASDLRTTNTVDHRCIFQTSGSGSIKWFQKDSQHRTDFIITSMEGTWTDINTAGRVVYSVERNTDRGKIIIEKNENGTFITLDFSETSTHAIKQRFRIQSVQITN